MRTGFIAIAFAASLLAANTASADINYGDFFGSDYAFLSVTESSATDPLPLYNAPGVFGNTLDFDPTMTASATGAAGIDLTDAQVNLQISSIEGVAIASLLFQESGDTSLMGPGTAATATGVAATFFVEVLEVDGVSIDPVMQVYLMTFSPSDGDFNLADDGSVMGQPWTGSLFIDIEALLAANDIDGSATLVNVVFDNILGATSENGTSSVIAKKDSSVTVSSQIPAPGALALFGLAALGTSRRRR